jgi:hypothetical protein
MTAEARRVQPANHGYTTIPSPKISTARHLSNCASSPLSGSRWVAAVALYVGKYGEAVFVQFRHSLKTADCREGVEEAR